MDFKYIDISLLSFLTLGFFIAYVIYAIIYFVKFDKNVKLDSGGNTHGLSRICLCGIFFLFGLLIFDIICSIIFTVSSAVSLDKSTLKLVIPSS